MFDDAGVEKQIKRCDGVVRVDANFLSGTATIVYDETRVSPDDIKTFIADCGYHCCSEVLNMKTLKEAR
jgi:Cu2+-exporting ATPase